MTVYKNIKNSSVAVSFFLLLLSVILLETRAEARVMLLPALTVSEEYNDNFFFTGPNKEEEYSTVITPTLTLKYENPSVILGATYLGGIRLQLKNDLVKEYLQRVTFDIGFPALSRVFNGVDVHVTEAFEQTPDIPSIPLGGPPRETFGTAVGRVNTARNAASLGLGYLWLERLRTDLTYRNTIVQYQGGVLEDFISHDTDLMGTYNISRRTRLTLTYGILITRFESSAGFTAQRMTLGGVHAMSSTFSTHGSFGGSLLPDNGRALLATLGFTKRLKRADIKLDYVRRITAGEGIIPGATLVQTISGAVIYPMSIRTLFAFGVDRTHTNGLLGPFIATISNTTAVTTTLTTTFLPWLTGSARYAYLKFDEAGGLLTRDLNRNMITFSLIAADYGLKLIK